MVSRAGLEHKDWIKAARFHAALMLSSLHFMCPSCCLEQPITFVSQTGSKNLKTPQASLNLAKEQIEHKPGRQEESTNQQV